MAKKSAQQKQAGEKRWLVRNEHGETFGPVHFETLKEWAQDGRLAPTSLVSTDAAAWSPVAHLPGLKMDWMAEVSPGAVYGPIHLQALEGLLKDGTIAPTAPLFVRSPGARAPHPAEARAEAAEQALAVCVEQAEQAQKWLTMQVAQLTALLAERDACLQRMEQREADFTLLQLLAQKIISAQEMGTQQVVDAVLDARAAAVAEVTQELARGRQALLHATATLAQDMKTGQAHIIADTRDTVAAVAQQVKHLSDGVQALDARCAHAAKPAEPKVERVYVEAEALEVIPPPPQRAHSRAVPKKASGVAEAVAPNPDISGAKGLSMAEIEQQAQRELERLGAQGVNLFKRTK